MLHGFNKKTKNRFWESKREKKDFRPKIFFFPQIAHPEAQNRLALSLSKLRPSLTNQRPQSHTVIRKRSQT